MLRTDWTSHLMSEATFSQHLKELRRSSISLINLKAIENLLSIYTYICDLGESADILAIRIQIKKKKKQKGIEKGGLG